MSGLSPVFSTGRGGAGNMVHKSNANSAADEVVVTDEQLQKSLNKSFKHDKDGNLIISSGRGGAGNMAKATNAPGPKVGAKELDQELSPIFSTGRGGRGNIVHSISSRKVDDELEDQISPIHSRKSQTTSVKKENGKPSTGFLKKIKKIFS